MNCATSFSDGLRGEAFVGDGGCCDWNVVERGICRGAYRLLPFLRGGVGVSTGGDLGGTAGAVVDEEGEGGTGLPNLGVSDNDDFERGREPLTRLAGVGMSLLPQQCPVGENKLGARDRIPPSGKWTRCPSGGQSQQPRQHGPSFPRYGDNQQVTRQKRRYAKGRRVFEQRFTSFCLSERATTGARRLAV